jgi:hypothetical protein
MATRCNGNARLECETDRATTCVSHFDAVGFCDQNMCWSRGAQGWRGLWYWGFGPNALWWYWDSKCVIIIGPTNMKICCKDGIHLLLRQRLSLPVWRTADEIFYKQCLQFISISARPPNDSVPVISMYFLVKQTRQGVLTHLPCGLGHVANCVDSVCPFRHADDIIGKKTCDK